ncbi:hypothetical protein FPQ18DRAFT_386156 [Pyronema domesticum]|nr:hypothetical protein FPQ18DRAFT_386156 [Pyronema domesticum]
MAQEDRSQQAPDHLNRLAQGTNLAPSTTTFDSTNSVPSSTTADTTNSITADSTEGNTNGTSLSSESPAGKSKMSQVLQDIFNLVYVVSLPFTSVIWLASKSFESLIVNDDVMNEV